LLFEFFICGRDACTEMLTNERGYITPFLHSEYMDTLDVLAKSRGLFLKA